MAQTNDSQEQVTINVETLQPVTRTLMTIGALPTSYLISMTYEEQLLWLQNYLIQTVIPAINNNAEATQEVQDIVMALQDYINDYFNNLDVQEEINNKLDQMAQDGTLTNLIEDYVNPYIESQNQEIANFKTSVNGQIASQNQEIAGFKTIVNNQIAVQNSQIQAVTSGSPLVASSVSGMTDTTKVYVNTTDGYWYYYNGTNWVQGGVYQSTGIADSSINYSNFDGITSQILNLEEVSYTLNEDHYINASGNVSSENTGYQYTSPIDLEKGHGIVIYTGGSANNVSIISLYTPNQTRYLPLVIADTGDNKFYYYIADDDIKVTLSGKKNPFTKIRIFDTKDISLLELLDNLNHIADGSYINGAFINYITGALGNNSGWDYTDYTGVLPGAKLKITSNIDLAPTSTTSAGIAFYTKEQRYISGEQYPQSTQAVFTIPNNAYYMRFSKRGEARIFNAVYEDLLIPMYNGILGMREEQEKFFDFSFFTKVGVLGDSYASGAFPEYSGASTAPAHYSMSWPAMLQRNYGFTLHNFSVNGQSTRTFLSNGKMTELLNTEKCDVYLLVLERNDYNIENNGETGYLGSITDITGHSLGSYPDTFYGNYATIIENILSYSSTSKLIMVTGDYLNELGTQYNEAVVEIAEHYNIPVMIENDDEFFNSYYYRHGYNANHPPAMKYNGMAVAMDRMLDKCIKEYDDYFAYTLPQ